MEDRTRLLLNEVMQLRGEERDEFALELTRFQRRADKDVAIRESIDVIQKRYTGPTGSAASCPRCGRAF